MQTDPLTLTHRTYNTQIDLIMFGMDSNERGRHTETQVKNIWGIRQDQTGEVAKVVFIGASSTFSLQRKEPEQHHLRNTIKDVWLIIF